MIKKFDFKDKKRLSLKAKIIITIFLMLMVIYLIDKFFDTYTFVFPIKKLEFQWIIQRRFQTSSKIPQNAQNLTKKAGKNYLPMGINPKISPTSKLEPATAPKLIPSKEAIYVYFGKNKTAYAIARAESGLDCSKIGYWICDKNGKCWRTNEPQDYGLFQINKVHLWRFEKFGGDPFNCWDNAKVAYEIYKEQGWRPWSAYNNKSYLAFLD